MITDKREKTTSFPAGTLIMEQGTTGDCAYIIESGLVEIFLQRPDGTETVITTRSADTIIGEMALIDQKTRTASIRALEDCTLIKITRDDFQQRLHSADPIMSMITKVILGRYRDTLSRVHVFGESDLQPPTEDLERRITQSGKAIDHLKTANDFKHGIHNGELILYYQPILELESKKVKGFEALMRWNHPEKGFMPPNLFIPIAEDGGLIIEASDWAMAESAQALTRIQKETGQSGLFMSVNFTAIDILHPDFLKKLLAVCERTGVSPHQIKIEMTERLLMNNPQKVKDILQSCRDAGFKIAIDDFGTGYSSLSYLHHYPIDTLKIDRSFIVQMTQDHKALNLVKGIIVLARNLDMNLVAEGIEERREEALLLQMHCDMAQGYKYAKPMAEGDVMGWMKTA